MSKTKPKRVLNFSVLPDQPTDGSGKLCIHLFIKDDKGSFVEPHVLHQVLDSEGNPVKGQLEAKPTRGRLACSRKLVPNVTPRNSIVTITMRSDDPRATTCPKCLTTNEHKTLIAQTKEEII